MHSRFGWLTDDVLHRQVLAMLGCVEEKRILELGAGIGRFTGHLAATARSVLAVDFMENLIEENKRANSHRSVSACTAFSTPIPPCILVSAPLSGHGWPDSQPGEMRTHGGALKCDA